MGILKRTLAGVALAATALQGCTAIPNAGPDDAAIHSLAAVRIDAGNTKPLTDYALVDLTTDVLSYFPPKTPQSLRGSFGASRSGPPTLPLGVGDVLEITLFESSAGGLFVPAEAGSRPGNFITLPQQTISPDGTITVPYVGRVNAAGRSAAQIQADIENRLADRAIEPQAVINLVRSRSSEVSVLGDVRAPAKFEINPGGERVLDVISRAGGISAPSAETSVTLQRSATTATVPFERLLSSPNENVYVYPGDVVFTSRDRRTYLAFGASGLNGRIDFEDSNLTFAEAVAKAGGLLDSRADPGQVFLYRVVDADTLSKMGIPATVKSGGGFPVIFRTNLRDPSAYFLAQKFPMEDKDIVYVSNADSVEVIKFLAVINSITSGVAGPAADAVTVRNAVRVLTR